MENGCLCKVIAQFPKLPRATVEKALVEESSDREITKSLLNLLHNAVYVGSVPVSRTQQDFFESHKELVIDLLGSAKSLKWKRAALQANIPLVINIAASYPTAV